MRSKSHADVSTYYGENSVCRNSLVADGCLIEGEVENCVLFYDVRVSRGAKLKNCILMRGCVVGEGVILNNVIADKEVGVSPYQTLMGSAKLPIVIPKKSKI